MSLLTVGLGVLPGEAAAAGVDFTTRGRRAAAAYRAMPHKRGITIVIPHKSDQIAARKRRGRKGRRPPGWTSKPTRNATLQNCSLALPKQ
jgi:hypothetical protein